MAFLAISGRAAGHHPLTNLVTIHDRPHHPCELWQKRGRNLEGPKAHGVTMLLAVQCGKNKWQHGRENGWIWLGRCLYRTSILSQEGILAS